MSSISSIGNTASTYSSSATNSLLKKPGTYEINVKEFGPVVATGMAGAQALGNTASSVVAISEKGLQQLASAVDFFGDTVGDAVTAAEEAVEFIGDSLEAAEQAVTSTLSDGFEAIEDTASDVIEDITHAAKTVGTETYEAASAVLSTAADVVGTVGKFASSTLGYVGQTAALGSAFIDSIV